MFLKLAGCVFFIVFTISTIEDLKTFNVYKEGKEITVEIISIPKECNYKNNKIGFKKSDGSVFYKNMYKAFCFEKNIGDKVIFLINKEYPNIYCLKGTKNGAVIDLISGVALIIFALCIVVYSFCFAEKEKKGAKKSSRQRRIFKNASQNPRF